jgi:hypothetical protein
VELRPLGFGEIFDRAITLYLKNFKPFFTIVLVVLVPYAFVQYAVDAQQSTQFEALFWVFKHPHDPLPAALTTPQSPAQVFLYIGIAIAFYAIWIVTVGAVSVGVAQLYRGRPVDFRACYRVALSRWPSMLGMLLWDLCLLVLWYLLVLVVAVLSFLLAALLSKAAVIAGVLAFIVAIVLTLAALASALPLFVALTCAMYAVPIERLGPLGALASGFSRIFSQAEFWRATLFAIAALAAAVAGSALIGVVTALLVFEHWLIPAVALSTLMNAAIAPFSIVLLAVYYFDVRIRREGYDLEAELERVTAPPV